jgi:glyoxylate reductase
MYVSLWEVTACVRRIPSDRIQASTRHIISTEQFAIMKPSVVIVNTARGAVIDEEALVEALNSGKVANVGLDVFEEEPKIHPGLLENEKVLLLPHMGTHTTETELKMEEWALDNVRLAVTEGTLKSIVSEQKEMQSVVSS